VLVIYYLGFGRIKLEVSPFETIGELRQFGRSPVKMRLFSQCVCGVRPGIREYEPRSFHSH